MQSTPLKSLYDFIDNYGREHKKELILYRGQDCPKPLLPKIARDNPARDSTELEKGMIEELRRLGGSFLPAVREDDIDLLVRAQHYGMATRLLDWTTNPLVALWFACRDRDIKKAAYVYFYAPKPDAIPGKDQIGDIFTKSRTIIYRPRMNNARILAQGGWFTLHPFSTTAKKFVKFEVNSVLKPDIDCLEIKGSDKDSFLDDLDQLGINYMSMFPDLEGACRHLNWKFDA